MMPQHCTVKRGRYRHYKGGLYRVTGTATYTETGECFVLYRSAAGGGLWARPLASFSEVFPEGHGDEAYPRFSYVPGFDSWLDQPAGAGFKVATLLGVVGLIVLAVVGLAVVR